MKKTPEPVPQKTTFEVCAEMLQALHATGSLLDFLKQVGDFKYRTKFLSTSPMSSQELEEHVEEQIYNLIQANREYYMMYHFIMRENLWPRFEMFRAECQKEVAKQMEEARMDTDGVEL